MIDFVIVDADLSGLILAARPTDVPDAAATTLETGSDRTVDQGIHTLYY